VNRAVNPTTDTIPTNTELVAAAAQGDWDAWDGLVDRYAALVWSVARGSGLDVEAAAAASLATWRCLACTVGNLDDPERLGEWLADRTARNVMHGRDEARAVWPGPPEAL